MDIFGIESMDDKPKQFQVPHFLHLESKENQYKWLSELGQKLLSEYVKLDQDKITKVGSTAAEMDTNETLITEMYDAEKKQYCCTCNKKYKTKGFFKRHLEKQHNWLFTVPPDETSSPSSRDHIAIWRASFMKVALILRDTDDAYSMGDGNRIFRNTKFEMLCADVAHHTKYRIWLWRMQAYECAILTPRHAFEYKWNCSANMHGGRGKNIPNDNLVENTVQAIKKKLRDQGSNVTHESAEKVALAVQIQGEIRDNAQRQFMEKLRGTTRPKVDKTSDLKLMIAELQAVESFRWIPGREYNAFSQFKDIFSRVDVGAIFKWISDQKERASYEMF